MDLTDDEDMFAISDEEVVQPVAEVNPVEETLITELNNIQKRIDQTNTGIKEVQSFIKKVLKQFAHRAQFGEELDLDLGGEVYLFYILLNYELLFKHYLLIIIFLLI